MTAIRRIWLQQPLAFARVGGSSNPLPAFRWSQPDLRPRGTGKTMIVPAPTFRVEDGTGRLIQEDPRQFTLLKDKEGIRPVCPFFELHGNWDGQDLERDGTAITRQVLEGAGLKLSSLVWSIAHANHKASSLTGVAGDRIEASLRIQGDDFASHELRGCSPAGTVQPLVPQNASILMGRLQVIQPTDELPGIRLRFIAPPGHAYGPTDLHERLTRKGLLDRIISWFGGNADWREFELPPQRRTLNPAAAWPQYKLLTWRQILCALPRVVLRLRTFIALCRQVQRSELVRFVVGPKADVGKLPPGLYASRIGNGAVLASLGLVDDLGDGIISCEIAGVGVARARIVVAPPIFSPDRRPPVSIADDLADRTSRDAVRAADWADARHWAIAEAEMDDLLDRAFETAGASNLDAWSEVLRSQNESDAVYRGDAWTPEKPGDPIWKDMRNTTVLDLPLTEEGRWRHRRNTADEFFEQLLRDNDELLTRWIRNPDDPESLYYDRRMPALMRGSDRKPLHLTRRQLEAFRKWIVVLRQRQKAGAATLAGGGAAAGSGASPGASGAAPGGGGSALPGSGP
jgi:hypothetical protein